MAAHLSEFTPKRIAVKLNKGGQRSVKQGHPWVFQNSIVKANPDPQTGDLALIFDNHTDKLIGLGYFDLESPIRIKLLYNQGATTINKEFFEERIRAAYGLRAPLLATNTNGYRLLFGENDGFPGLITDIYAKVAVVKLYSGIWQQHLAWMAKFICELCGTECVVLRLSRNMQKSGIALKDGQILYGTLKQADVTFKEHGLNFIANVLKGHKTGYFLDHRHNRKMVGGLSYGKRVLDVFAYAGGFSVHSLAGGAKEVTSVDISAHALELAKENAAINSHTGSHICLKGDAFEVLESLSQQGEQYDIVVIDPPAFAKQQDEITRAKKAYRKLVSLGVPLVAKGGMFVMASCSARVSAGSFFDLVAEALKESKVDYTLIQKTAHDVDHPIGFPEGAYLKCGYYKIK